GVGILLAEKWMEHVLEVKRISDRICAMKINVGFTILTTFSIYAPQVGLDDEAKDSFYDELFCAVSKTAETESLFLCGDFNGHVGSMAGGYEGVHGGYGYGERNPEGVRLLDFAVANELVITNSMFQKRSSHLVTYQSGGASTQVDYILTRKNNFRHVTNTKVVPNEECALQHKLVICDKSLPLGFVSGD
ncbi:predicted protein, partial [Nematostella vectensis]